MLKEWPFRWNDWLDMPITGDPAAGEGPAGKALSFSA
jgi:hypothetical protein